MRFSLGVALVRLGLRVLRRGDLQSDIVRICADVGLDMAADSRFMRRAHMLEMLNDISSEERSALDELSPMERAAIARERHAGR